MKVEFSVDHRKHEFFVLFNSSSSSTVILAENALPGLEGRRLPEIALSFVLLSQSSQHIFVSLIFLAILELAAYFGIAGISYIR